MAQDIKSLKVGIVGMGAVGSFLAALFYRVGLKVYCFGSEHSIASIAKSGILLKSPVYGDDNYLLDVNFARPPILDLLFVTVKSPKLKDCLVTLRDKVKNNTIIIPLLNGIGHRELIRKEYGKKVVVGTIGSIEVSLDSHRVVHHVSKMTPVLEIASDVDVQAHNLNLIASLIEFAGLSASVGKSENEVIWRKLVRLSAIATMTALTNLTIGEIRSDNKLRNHLAAIIKELLQIAFLEGVILSEKEVMQQIDKLPNSMTTSMQRDIWLGRESEIESILGEPIKLGKLSGLTMPTMEQSYMTIRSRIDG